MAGASSGQTVADALKKVFTEVASMKLLPDAQTHAQFLDGLMGGIQKYLQMQAGAAAQAGGQANGAQGGMGGPGGGMGASPMGGGMGGMGGNPGGAGAPPGMRIAPGGGAGMSGLMGGANPDELKRLLGVGQPG